MFSFGPRPGEECQWAWLDHEEEAFCLHWISPRGQAQMQAQIMQTTPNFGSFQSNLGKRQHTFYLSCLFHDGSGQSKSPPRLIHKKMIDLGLIRWRGQGLSTNFREEYLIIAKNIIRSRSKSKDRDGHCRALSSRTGGIKQILVQVKMLA